MNTTRHGAEGTGSLEKALDVLDAVGQSPEGLSQNEITERLALPRTTVYRLLSTLVARGMLRRDPLRKVYCLGFRCFEMARQAYASPDLAAAAAEELRAMRDLTGETAYLATLDGLEVLSIERCDGAHPLRSAAALGQRKPLYCTSQGKAILSALPPGERDEIVRGLTLKALTPHTLTDRRRLQAELKIVASRGWAMDDEEIVLGVRCVGAPIVDGSGAVRGAISVAGPAWRITRERAELLGPEVAEAARRVGAQLRRPTPQAHDQVAQAVPGPWAFFGAFPRHDARTGALYWCDTLAPSVRVHDAQGDRQLIEVESPVTGLLLRENDLIVTHETGVLRVTFDGRSAPVTTWPGGKLHALCGGAGDAVWAALSTPQGVCAVGLIQPGGGFEARWTLDEAVQALAWAPAAGLLYATAPASGSVLVLQPGSHLVRRLATLPKGSGRVSGLAPDGHGGLWTALRDGWSVVHLTADGSVDRVIGLPVPCPTDLVLVDQKLYVTTARQPVTLDALEKAPLSGRLQVVQDITERGSSAAQAGH